jgi:hypothetical protein
VCPQRKHANPFGQRHAAKYLWQASSVANWRWNSRIFFGNGGRATPLHYLWWFAETNRISKRVLVAAMLFVPAGTWRFWQGWALLVLVLIPAFSCSLYLCKHDPQLIERRLQSKEKIREQKLIAKLLKLVVFDAFLLPGLDYRLGWSRTVLGGVPLWLTLLSQTLVLGGLLFVFWVMRVNSFASRTIQVEAAQKVISTGPTE